MYTISGFVVFKGEHVKFRTKVGSLLDALALTAPTLDRKGASSNLYLEANDKSNYLYLYSTNLIAETSTKIKVEIEKPGKILINPIKLTEGLSGIGREVAIDIGLSKAGTLKVSVSNVQFSLASSPDVEQLSTKMRAIPSKSDPVAVIPTTEISEFTKRAQFCIPNDQTGQRANLAALKISDTADKEEAFATDGSIAVYVSTTQRHTKPGCPGLGPLGILIPSQTLQALSQLTSKKKGETVSILMPEKKNKVYFKFADDTYYGVLTLASQYPNLRPIVEQTPEFTFDISRESLKHALDRANAFVSSAATKKILELEFCSDAMNLKANGDDLLSDYIGITYKGNKPTKTVRLGMNIDHLINITSGSHSEFLSFGFTKEDSPLVVTDTEGDDDDLINVKYIVMGVRLSSKEVMP